MNGCTLALKRRHMKHLLCNCVLVVQSHRAGLPGHASSFCTCVVTLTDVASAAFDLIMTHLKCFYRTCRKAGFISACITCTCVIHLVWQRQLPVKAKCSPITVPQPLGWMNKKSERRRLKPFSLLCPSKKRVGGCRERVKRLRAKCSRDWVEYRFCPTIESIEPGPFKVRPKIPSKVANQNKGMICLMKTST